MESDYDTFGCGRRKLIIEKCFEIDKSVNIKQVILQAYDTIMSHSKQGMERPAA